MREKEILLGKEGVGVVGVTSAPQTVPPRKQTSLQT